MIMLAVALDAALGAPVQQAAFWQTSTGIAALLTLLGALGAAWVGGKITSKATLEAVRESDRQERQRRETQERNEINNYRKAIISEVQCLWTQYMWGIGERLEQAPKGIPFELFYPVGQNYFSVYDNNMSTLAKIEDDEERALIIDGYLTAKGLVDSYGFNNKLLDGFHQLMAMPKIGDNCVDRLRAGTVQALKEYSDILKEAHYRAKEKHKNLLDLLQKKLEQEQ